VSPKIQKIVDWYTDHGAAAIRRRTGRGESIRMSLTEAERAELDLELAKIPGLSASLLQAQADADSELDAMG